MKPEQSRKTALVMCLADPSSHPRPNRFVHLLNQLGFTVDVLSFAVAGDVPVRNQYVVPVLVHSRLARLGRVLNSLAGRFAGSVLRSDRMAEWFNDRRFGFATHDATLRSSTYDLMVVEDLQMLPLAFGHRGGAKVLFDAREFYPRQNEERWLFRLLEASQRTRLCERYLRRCDRFLTVSPGLADAYAADFGVEVDLVRSTPVYHDIAVQSTPPDAIRMVHHGIANENRGLSNMMEITRRLDDRFTLDLYLVGPDERIDELRQKAKNCPRIRFCKPVPFEQIMPMLNDYDLGFFYVEPSTFNLLHCLPNKFFEFIQARLAVVIGPSPDMASLVRQYGCGFVAPEFSLASMIQTLESLTPESIDRAKAASDVAARELCFERESIKLQTIIEDMTPSD